MNGRSNKDIMGRMIFKNVSVIDYFILSLPGYLSFHDFEVVKVNSQFSDGHSLLELTLKINTAVREPIIYTHK